jgi:hypothetical protein
MPANSISKAAILMVVIVVASVISWEIYLRNTGLKISYDNQEPLWANKRAMVYKPSDKAVVFIGSSRIKYDLDIATWEAMTGTKAVQLACEGSNPVPVLFNLADDEKFKGSLVIDVTENLFFSPLVGVNAGRSDKVVKYFKEETPAQKAGFAINHVLESQFVFLDKEDLSMTAMLDKLQIPSRPGVFTLPFFPIEFTRVNFDRQSYMMPALLIDTNLQKRVTDMWVLYGQMASRYPPPGGDTLIRMTAERMNAVKAATDKIRARGGRVLFIRTPSSGPALMIENKMFPREIYWNKLLEITGCPGIHFADQPVLDHFVCPEWSHLSPADALIFTKEFVRLLRLNNDWAFLRSSATQFSQSH